VQSSFWIAQGMQTNFGRIQDGFQKCVVQSDRLLVEFQGFFRIARAFVWPLLFWESDCGVTGGLKGYSKSPYFSCSARK
jgi:hypothetical protein